jgi:glycerol-3-phosphate acyltransferase PlsX
MEWVPTGPPIRGSRGDSCVPPLDVRVHLVGPEEILSAGADARAARAALAGKLRKPAIEIVHASEWISMDDKAAQAVRAKRDSSMRVGLRMVREGAARGFFTAGNTGAAMATAKMVLGMLAGVHRPGLATILPTVTGSPSLLLDVGANVDCDPDNLVQFAVMGNMYARNVLRIGHPRVGLLSIGEEDSKGNQLTRDTFPLLRALSRHRLRRQRGGPRPVQRPRRRCGLRRLCRQHRPQDLRGTPSW